MVATHVSLWASPTPFLLLMEMLASSKLQEEAAWTAPVASRRREGIAVNRMLSGCVVGGGGGQNVVVLGEALELELLKPNGQSLLLELRAHYVA